MTEYPFIVVTTTADSRETAERLARMVVEQRLAACAQISGPIASTYWWKGAIESAQEWRVDMKTRADLYPRLEQAINSMHPYDTPEIIAVPMVAGYDRYLAWLDDETAARP